MKQAAEADPALRLIDDVLADLAVRAGMYVARRAADGDADTFVIQTGEDGRKRLPVPDLGSDRSIAAVVHQAQTHLGEVLQAAVPLCPLHGHALVGTVSDRRLAWVCPDRKWRCELGLYETMTWPQRELGGDLAPVLMRRVNRRGTFRAVRTIAVRQVGDELVADFGLTETTSELLEHLAAAADPLPIETHYSPPVMIQPLAAAAAGPDLQHESRSPRSNATIPSGSCSHDGPPG